MEGEGCFADKLAEAAEVGDQQADERAVHADARCKLLLRERGQLREEPWNDVKDSVHHRMCRRESVERTLDRTTHT